MECGCASWAGTLRTDGQCSGGDCAYEVTLIHDSAPSQHVLTCAALHRTMVSQLVQHERIETTLPRAKELRRLAEKAVTLGKEVRGAAQHAGGTVFRG